MRSADGGSGKAAEATYFVVSDEAHCRLRSLLLFRRTQQQQSPSVAQPKGSSATAISGRRAGSEAGGADPRAGEVVRRAPPGNERGLVANLVLLSVLVLALAVVARLWLSL